MNKPEILDIEFNVIYHCDIDDNSKMHHSIMPTDEMRDAMHAAWYGMGETKEEAIKSFWTGFKAVGEHNHWNNQTLNKRAIFLKGPWGSTGGNWFTILGINVSFRYGKNMKYGWYIPLTKLNITIHNHWRKNKKVKR